MSTFDRYVLSLYLKVLVICFTSLAGLYIVFDAFNNMDEFLTLGKRLGGLDVVLTDYYGARIPWFFDRGSSLLALVAALTAVHWLQRTNELTAVLAAGVPISRVVRPLVVAALFLAGGAAVNREVVLPRVRDRLVRNAQDWLGQQERPVQPVTDQRTEILIGGATAVAAERRIKQPTFLLYRAHGAFRRHVNADVARYLEGDADHPAGYLLQGVSEPAEPRALQSVVDETGPVILTPREHSWLGEHELFVASDVGFDQLLNGAAWRRYSSTTDLIAELRNPSLDFGLESKVIVHSRFVQPLLDLSLFLLGLPLVLGNGQRSIFVAVGWCFLLVVVYFVVLTACQSLGNLGYFLSPSLAAWLPLLVFGPFAAAFSSILWQR